MFGKLRTGAFASAFFGLAAMFASPSVAAQAQTAPVVSTPTAWNLPANAVPQPGFSQQQVVAQPAAQPVKNPFAALPALVRPVAPAVQYPRQPRSIQDMVATYVNFGDQDEQQECLAKAVYFEARSESLEGQLAVAEVVLNRAASGVYPSTICEVVTQPWQFSFIRKGRFPTPDRSSRSWHNAVAIANIANKNLAEVVPANVLWYHANYVSPSWGRRLTRVTQIGAHIFYS